MIAVKIQMKFLIIFSFFILIGCSGPKIYINPIPDNIPKQKICIQHNSDVTIPGFETSVRENMNKIGIESIVFKNTMPKECNDIMMGYSARRSWDFKTFIAEMNFNVFHNNLLVGSAEYKQNNNLNLSKFGRAEENMPSMIKNLFNN